MIERVMLFGDFRTRLLAIPFGICQANGFQPNLNFPLEPVNDGVSKNTSKTKAR